MARGTRSFETHDFYCIRCGRKGIPCQRKKGQQHGKGHFKKLFCIYCGEEINHYECRSLEDVEKFKKNFEKGVYKDEAENSLTYVRAERSGKVLLG